MLCPPITGVILAGGRSTRMGGQDKGLIPFQGRPLFQHAVIRLQSQVEYLLINTNRHQEVYSHSGYPVIQDSFPSFAGPLAGILSALEVCQTEWLLCVPCDTPFFPENLKLKLWEQRQGKTIAYVRDNERKHPTLALIHRAITQDLRDYLESGDRQLLKFYQQQSAQAVYFDSDKSFININTPVEYQQWENNNG